MVDCIRISCAFMRFSRSCMSSADFRRVLSEAGELRGNYAQHRDSIQIRVRLSYNPQMVLYSRVLYENPVSLDEVGC